MPPIPPGDGDHDKPWLPIYPAGVPATYPYPSVHAGRLLDDAAQDFPDTIAIEYRRYRLSYRKLLDHTDRLATALSALGVGPGRDVALLLPNCPQLIIALFATWRVGGRVRLLTPRDASVVASADPRVIIVIDRWYERLVAPRRRALGPHSSVMVTGTGDYLPFPENVLVPVRRALRSRSLRLRDAEGVVKFAELVRRNLPVPEQPPHAQGLPALASRFGDITQRQLVVNSFQLRLWLPDVVAGDERVLLGVPMSSTLGAVWILTSVLAAATMILVDNRRAAGRQRLAIRAQPTILPVDEELCDHLVRSSRRRRNPLSSVRIAISRDALSPQRRHALEEVTDKGRIRQAWGVFDLLTHADPVYGRYEEGTVGLPLPDTTVMVADPADPARPIQHGVRGRLWMRGPQLEEDTWVDAGVDATLHSNGYLTIHDVT